MTTLSIIIPVYNEAKTIAQVINSVKNTPLGSVKKQIVAVDDGSTDETLPHLQNIEGITLIQHQQNRGKGAAIRTGLNHATGDIIIIQDADLEYNPHDIALVLKPLLDGEAHVVFGSRFLPRQASDDVDTSKGNKIYYAGNKLLSLFASILYGQRITDMETCYKAFTKEALHTIELTSSRFDFEPEITAKFLRKGYRILEVPIRYSPRSAAEGKKITWKDGIQAFAVLVKYRFFD